MKKANYILFPFLLGLIFFYAAPAQTPSASFKRMWIDYDVTQGNQKGMRIHTEFEVHNMKGTSGYLGLYFQYRDGTALRDKNQQFYSSAGEVAVYVEINPAYNPTTWYEDLATFMPYNELDLPDGKYDLQIQANVIYKQGGIIGQLTNYDFVYTQGNTTTPKKTPSANFKSSWVDYDIREGGRKGMRVHVKFSTSDMRGIDGKLAVFFQKRGGDPLFANSQAYRATGQRVGEMVLYYAITPRNDETDYADLSMFIPYSEFKSVLERGTHNLQMDIDVLYQNGTLIEHLSTEDFWFEW